MRAAIFIDGGYFLQQLKTANLSPDYERMADHLLMHIRQAVPVDFLRCYFYYCAPWMPQNPSEEAQRRMDNHVAFVEKLESISRWEVKLGKLERRWDGQKEYFEQKRVDVLLSIDLVKHATAGHIQHAILLAGDSDFIPAVKTAKEEGVVVSLWCGESNTVHKDLIRLVDEVHTLNWARFPGKRDGGSASSSPAQSTRPAATPRPDLEPGPRPTRARGERAPSSSESRPHRHPEGHRAVKESPSDAGTSGGSTPAHVDSDAPKSRRQPSRRRPRDT